MVEQEFYYGGLPTLPEEKKELKASENTLDKKLKAVRERLQRTNNRYPVIEMTETSIDRLRKMFSDNKIVNWVRINRSVVPELFEEIEPIICKNTNLTLEEIGFLRSGDYNKPGFYPVFVESIENEKYPRFDVFSQSRTGDELEGLICHVHEGVSEDRLYIDGPTNGITQEQMSTDYMYKLWCEVNDKIEMAWQCGTIFDDSFEVSFESVS
jgi:hypothetical protein